MNKKTGVSYDFSICPLMRKEGEKYKSLCGVKDCYSVQLLNRGQGSYLTKKLERPFTMDEIKKDVSIFNSMYDEGYFTLIRGFSFGDFNPDFLEEFLYIVRNVRARNIIISKNLWLQDLVSKVKYSEVIKEVSEKTELSMGFTKTTYRAFKKWYSKNTDLKIGIAFTETSKQDLVWLKEVDPDLYNKVTVFHSTYLHFRISRQFTKKKKTNDFTPVSVSMQKNFQNYIEDLKKMDYESSQKFCGVFGDFKIKSCADCIGCGSHL